MRTDTPVQIKLSDYTSYPFEIDQVEMVFDLEPSATRVKTRMQVRRVGDGEMVLDGIKLTLNSLFLNGQAVDPADFEQAGETLILRNVPDQFELQTDVTIDPSANTELSGLYISGGRFCTQCEAVGFRRITYWPDRPDVMSRFKVRLEANKAQYPILLSNGTPGESGDLGGGRHFAEWDDPHPKPSYLFALCGGDYDIHRDTFTTMNGAAVDLAVHVDKGDAERAIWAMDSLKASMKWDEEVFKREYDLGVFNIVAVRDFNFGAMENKGLNIFNSAYVLADESTATDADFEAIESIVGHEYFHNWTGNRITCRDWFQLCLKEGLTVFRDQEFSADMRSRPVQRIKDVIRLRARQFSEDGGPLAHPVRPATYASIDNLYTATVYEKGAELIRMLKTLIGDDAFDRGMQLYFDRHDGQAVTIEDFYSCFEQASGQDLSGFRRWYAQPGTPTISAVEDWNEATGTLTVTLSQSTPKTPQNEKPQPLPMPLRVAAFDPEEGHKIEEKTLTVENGQAIWTLIGLPRRPLLSLNRGFSAPVYLKHDLGKADRLALARLDDDRFNQWDSLQTLARAELLALAYDANTEPDAELVVAIADAALAAKDDPAFAALLLRLPDIGELFQHRLPANPAALERARNQMRKALAEQVSETAAAILAQPTPLPFQPNAEQAGIRALRSAMISLMGALGESDADARLKAIFDDASNMTESLGALRALCEANAPQKADALEAFAKRWGDNPLVMDKWFAVQAATGTVEDVEALLSHPLYDAGNPNRVRAVTGVFAMQNLSQFHAPDGRGYALVAKVIADSDTRNPALAARLLTAFEAWRQLEPVAKAAAEAEMQNLLLRDLSKNVGDILSRTLA
ncbi:aminopeptidase N [Hyphomonas sp. FCG-A18]|uniref:aminopeptidase N n=1 Tax=Hyphomonas sp. FCG-A18 TaxID=3080019 RepID=UPI002B301D30|nr:aminopeptidase N [Hyphomonas sp. FCG-A18]